MVQEDTIKKSTATVNPKSKSSQPEITMTRDLTKTAGSRQNEILYGHSGHTHYHVPEDVYDE